MRPGSSLRATRSRAAGSTTAELATGDIHLGTKALELGLIDELGTLDDAVEQAASLAGIKPETPVRYVEDED